MPTDQDHFRAGVDTLVRLRRSGGLRFLAGVPGVIAPKLEMLEHGDNGEHFERAIAEAKIDRAALDEVAGEVAELLDVLVGDDDIEVLMPSTEAERNMLAEKRDLVRRVFEPDIDDLIVRGRAKSDAKTDVLTSIGWELLLKLGTEADDKPYDKPLPAALLQISAMPASEWGSLREQKLTVTLDREDVQYLIDTLERLYSAFETVAQ
jgi:hypothetical protein